MNAALLFFAYATTTPSFENCRWGVYTERNLSRPSGMNVKSTENNMLDPSGAE